MINLNPKDWLMAALGVAVAVLGALALFLGGNAKAARERLKDINLKATQAQKAALQRANEAETEAQLQAKQKEKKVVKDALENDRNPFNDNW